MNVAKYIFKKIEEQNLKIVCLWVFIAPISKKRHKNEV